MATANDDRPSGIPLSRISSGGLLRLDRNGDLVRPPGKAARKLDAEPALATGLDPRVGPGVLLGQDPPALPPTRRAQAEPHLARHPLDPDVLLGTFQEGRFTDGGAVNCGYSVSTNGGLSWSRSLIPGLTTNSGGAYLRATDPVAGIDLQGNLFLNNLTALDREFITSALVISRSTNGGVTFEAPVEIARSPDASVFLDKNWMTVNTFSNTATFGRIVSTFTRFEPTSHPIAISYSDDQGQTWSSWKYATDRVPFFAQGSQPVFLPSGSLAIVYWNFGWNQHPFQSIEVVVSTNGGEVFAYSNRVAVVSQYDAPVIRDGSFLPSAAGNRIDESIYVTYQGLVSGEPRILFAMSPDAGRTWTAPLAISDNPPGSPVFNPAVAASADGKTIGVLYCDQRVSRANVYWVDCFLARSLDGGVTWEPSLRVTSVSADASRGPLTSQGYMLGDYQGLVMAEHPNPAFIGIYIDTRTGSPDPFTSRIGVLPGYPGWSAARFSMAEIASAVALPQADPDADGAPNALEYALGQSPRTPDPAALSVRQRANDGDNLLSVEYERLVDLADVQLRWLGSSNLVHWDYTVPLSTTISPGASPRLERVTALFPVLSTGNSLVTLEAAVHAPP